MSFSPAAEPFGFLLVLADDPVFFKARTVYTEDARNTFDTTSHHVRVYPLAGQNGEPAYVLATDESKPAQRFQRRGAARP